MFFSRHASDVTILVRGESLEASMSHYLIEQIAGIENIHVRTHTTVKQAHGDEHLERLTLCENGVTETVETGHLFIFIGAAPRTDWLGDAIHRDEHGFVCTGPGPAERRAAAGGLVARP